MYLVCKLLYVSLFAALSAAPPYLPLYYHDILGFSSKQIGFVLAIAPFIQSISCPLWTYVVDKKPRLHGVIMAVICLLGGSAIMSIMMIGRLISSGSLPVPFIHSYITSTGLEISNTSLVLIISTLALTFAFFSLPNMALVDSAVMKTLGPNKILYGEQRLWGSISAGLTILLVGQLISMSGNLEGLFWVCGAFSLLFSVFCFFLDTKFTPEPLAIQQDVERISTNTSEKLLNNNRIPVNNYSSINNSKNSHYVELFKSTSIASAHTIREEADETLDTFGGVNLGLSISRIASMDQSVVGLLGAINEDSPPPSSILGSVRVLTFLLGTLIFGFVMSMIVNFLFLFLGRDLHMPANWIGWTGPTAGITELLCFCFSKQLTEYFGVTKLILLAHAATMMRCLLYTLLKPDSYLTNVCALFLQTLHGIGFGVFWATAVNEMDGFFPPEQRSVAQGILGALHFGLGAGLGALAGGYLYDYAGPIWMFRLLAIVTGFNMVLFYVGRLERFNL